MTNSREQQGFPPVEKFMSKVSKEADGCWLWMGARGDSGYGSFHGVKGTTAAHRASYILFVGHIPKGNLVCHRCDNPPCVNPNHLFVGTYTDNNRDMAAKGRSACGERNGSAKLSLRQVGEVFAARKRGLSYPALGRKFGISQSHAFRIINRQNWRLGNGTK